MRFALKTRKISKLIILVSSLSLVTLVIFWSFVGAVWTRADFQALDLFYKKAVDLGYTPKSSPLIVYLTLTDESYQYFGQHIISRADLAAMNEVLGKCGPEAVAYDMIFVRPSGSSADQRFAESIKTLGRVYLPIAFELSEQPRMFQQGTGTAYERLQKDFLKQPVEEGTPHPQYAVRALKPLDILSEISHNSGHINAPPDPDGVQRHHLMLVRVNSAYLPTLSLSMFLDYIDLSLDDVIVHWGNDIRIPAANSRYLEEDVVIPIDEHGRTFIPFPQVWGKDFLNMSAHHLLEYAKDVNLRGNLTDFFEGKFVFIGEVSQGSTDIGQTTLEENVPLIAIHTALLNSLLNNAFYRQWSFEHVLLFIIVLGIILMLSALPKASWIFYTAGCLLFLGLIGFTWFQLVHFSLFPIVTVGGSFLLLFVGLVIGLEVTLTGQQAFIRNAFAKFVPATVVEELIARPEKLTLGGEEREITILFADLENFTGLSEQLPPRQLVLLLNEYLSQMTRIILEEGGTIDKYIGDEIMAEFGAPLVSEHHADQAVSAALKMQIRLRDLRRTWAMKHLPALQCRIGIHTGSVIIGNMGSDRVFDYTVIGDAANLASRLEGANKRYNTYLMISESTHQALTPSRFLTRMLGVIKVKGREREVKVFEVYGETSETITSEDSNIINS